MRLRHAWLICWQLGRVLNLPPENFYLGASKKSVPTAECSKFKTMAKVYDAMRYKRVGNIYTFGNVEKKLLKR